MDSCLWLASRALSIVCVAPGAFEMAKSVETGRRDAAKQRAEKSRLRAASAGRPRTDWVYEAISRGLAIELRDNAKPSDIAAGIATVNAKTVIRSALRILIDERQCDRKESLWAISRALGVRDHPDRKLLTSAPSAPSRTAP
jgi:hypothetical protein